MKNTAFRTKFWSFLTPVYGLFQVFCFAPAIITVRPLHYKRLLSIRNAILPGASLLWLALCFYDFDILGTPDDFTNRAIVLCLHLTNIVVIIESLNTQSNRLWILQQLLEWDEHFWRTFNVSMNFDQLKLRYTITVYMACVGVASSYVTGCCVYYKFSNRAIIGVICLNGMAKMIIHMKLIENGFYLDMVTERLQMINVILGRIKGVPGSLIPANTFLTPTILGALVDIQLMYGQLWEIIKEIDLSFGWSMMTIVIENIIDLVNDSHIMYCNIVGSYNNVTTFGKHRHFFSSYNRLMC